MPKVALTEEEEVEIVMVVVTVTADLMEEIEEATAEIVVAVAIMLALISRRVVAHVEVLADFHMTGQAATAVAEEVTVVATAGMIVEGAIVDIQVEVATVTEIAEGIEEDVTVIATEIEMEAAVDLLMEVRLIAVAVIETVAAREAVTDQEIDLTLLGKQLTYWCPIQSCFLEKICK